MFARESQRKQGRLSTLQFESEKSLLLFSVNSGLDQKLYLLSQLNYNELSRAQKILPLGATPHIQTHTSLGSGSLFTDPLFYL